MAEELDAQAAVAELMKADGTESSAELIPDETEVEETQTAEEDQVDEAEADVSDDSDEQEADADDDETDSESEVETLDASYDDVEVHLNDDVGDVKLSELKQGYMRLGIFTKKTQDLAERRKDLEKLGEETGALSHLAMASQEQVIKKYAQAYNQLPPIAQQLLNELNGAHQQLRGASTKWLERIADVRDGNRQQHAKEQIELLRTHIPAWGPDKYTQVLEFYTGLGTPQDDIKDLIDSGMMAGLYNGMLAMKGKSEAKTALKPLKRTAKKRFKSGSNATPNRRTRSQKVKSLNRNLNKEATADAAVDLLMEIDRTNG